MSRKLVTLIRDGNFKEAELFINSSESSLGDVTFEKAYVLYRLNRDDDALSVLAQGDDKDYRSMELKAQIFYRVDRFEEAYNLLLTVIKNSDDDFDAERQANLLAISARLEGQGIRKNPKINFSTYEHYYNHACCLIERQHYTEALETLDKAEECCRGVLVEEGLLTAEEIEEEISIITAQKDHVRHLMGQVAAEKGQSVNVDELEEVIFVPKSSKQRKEGKKAVADTEIVTGKLRSKKRKRKTVVPKNIDPSVKPDPERWLPRQERTAYKKWLKRHKDHDIGRGTQGAVSSHGTDMITESSSPRQSSTPSAPVPEGPRQQRPAQQKKKSKKKGGR